MEHTLTQWLVSPRAGCLRRKDWEEIVQEMIRWLVRFVRDIYTRISSLPRPKAPHLQLTISATPHMQDSTRTRYVIGVLVLSPRTACSRSDQLAFDSISCHIKLPEGIWVAEKGLVNSTPPCPTRRQGLLVELERLRRI